MRPEEGDAALLWDMLRYAREVESFVKDRSLEDYQSNVLLRRAVERSVGVIGEAAWRTSATLQKAHPHIPWKLISGQRHILVHDYRRLKDDKVWRVATIHIPELVRLIEPLLPPLPPEAR